MSLRSFIRAASAIDWPVMLERGAAFARVVRGDDEAAVRDDLERGMRAAKNLVDAARRAGIADDGTDPSGGER